MRESFRKLAKIFLCGIWYYSGISGFLRLLERIHLKRPVCTVLTYHRVMPRRFFHHGTDSSSQIIRSLTGITTSAEAFEDQIRFLVRHFNVITLRQLVEMLEQEKRILPNSVVIAFDDGWRDNYEYALPILCKYRIPVTIFLTTGYIGTSKLFWPEEMIFLALQARNLACLTMLPEVSRIDERCSRFLRRAIASRENQLWDSLEELIGGVKRLTIERRNSFLEALKRHLAVHSIRTPSVRVMLNWDEVNRMPQDIVSFGGHGVSHEILPQLDIPNQIQEISESQRQITEKAGQEAFAFAYPNGDYSPNTKVLVRAAGYRCAATTQSGAVTNRSDLFALPRVNIHEGTSHNSKGNFSKAIFSWHLRRPFQRKYGCSHN